MTTSPTFPNQTRQKLFTDEEDARLREALKRCSSSTYEAARAFRTTGQVKHLPVIIDGVIERYVERDIRAKLGRARDHLRLGEDLGLDSLTMMEIVFLAEEVLPITIEQEELRHVQTVGDLKEFIGSKLRFAKLSRQPSPDGHSA